MPLIAGSVTCRRYRVPESPPDGYLQPFARSIARNGFRPIDDAAGMTESAGWVNPRNPLDTNLNPSEWHIAPYVLLGYRLDKKSVPSRILRARVELAVREKARTGLREKLSREQRAEIEVAIRNEMLREMMAATRVVEIAWNVESGRLIVSTTATSMNDLVVGAFTETFGLTPIPLFPAIVAEEWAEAKNRVRDLNGAFPVDLYARVRDKMHTLSDGSGGAEVVDAISGAGLAAGGEDM